MIINYNQKMLLKSVKILIYKTKTYHKHIKNVKQYVKDISS